MKLLAADIGGSHATCAIVEGPRVLERQRIEIPAALSLGAALNLIGQSSRSLLKTVQLDEKSLAGIAVSFCGLVDPVRRRVLSTNGKYEDGPSIDLKAWARVSMGLSIRIENDARMALLGEWYAGAGRGVSDLVTVTLGTGVGGAAMINSKLIRGRHFQAGCLGGHLGARIGGRMCTCGNIGCVEAEASTWALPAICRERAGFASSALIREPVLDLLAVCRCAEHGDEFATEVLEDCIRVWSAGIVSLIHAYDPEVVVVGGGVMRSARVLLPRFQQYVAKHAWTPWGNVEIRAAALGDDASLLGAVPLWEDPAL